MRAERSRGGSTQRKTHSAPRSTSIGVGPGAANAGILFALIVAALYIGKIVFLPFAVAILLAFVLAPIVKVLRVVRIPRTAAVAIVVVTTFSAVLLVGAVLTDQARQLASELPRYQFVLRDKVRDLRGAAFSSPVLERATETLKELQNELEGDADTSDADQSERNNRNPESQIVPDVGTPAPGTGLRSGLDGGSEEPVKAPIPVEIHYPEPRPIENLINWLTPMIEPFAMIAVVIVLLFFVLLQKEELRDRFIRLSGTADMQRTTAAMTDAAQRLSRFLLTLTALNFAYGAFIAVALWWLGIPAPILWGLVAALMRYVPILGSFIAAAFPVVLAAAVDPQWNTLLLTAGLFIVSEGLMGQFIEPLIQGRTTGLSPLAILVSAAFWTLLWGPVGLLLAVPMTLCLVVLGQHVDGFKFIHVMLGDEPAFSPGERFYQRTLAGDSTELTEMAEQRLKSEPLSVYYRDVTLEGLRLAQIDADRGMIENEHMERIADTVETMVDNLWDASDRLPEFQPNNEADGHEQNGENGRDRTGDRDLGTAGLPVLDRDHLRKDWDEDSVVLCIPAKSPIDEAAAHVVSHLINRHGLDAIVATRSDAFSGQNEGRSTNSPVICICSLSEQLGQSRYLARRIARRFPSARILVLLWGSATEAQEDFAQSESKAVHLVAGDLYSVLSDILAFAEGMEESEKISPSATDDAASEFRSGQPVGIAGS